MIAEHPLYLSPAYLGHHRRLRAIERGGPGEGAAPGEGNSVVAGDEGLAGGRGWDEMDE